MSERSLSLTALPADADAEGDGAEGGGDLIRSLAPLLAEWLPHQRWFAGKGRPVTGFGLVSATQLLPCSRGSAAPGLLHLLVRARQQPDSPSGAEPLAAAAAEPGAGDCYQLLLGVRGVLPAELAPALIGRPTCGPLHGRTVYEALHDPWLAGLLLERLRVPGRLGRLHFARESDAGIPGGLRARPLAAEQSNSSLVYGTQYILKLFRRIGPGLNPDLELPLALARRGCARVPAPTAWFEATQEAPGAEGMAPPDETVPDKRLLPAAPASGAAAGTASAPLTLGVLQPFLPESQDGWQLALHALAGRDDFTGASHSLGRATAEVHTGLAEALPTTVLHRPQLERLAADMAARLEAAGVVVPALRPYRSELRNAFAAVAELGRGGHLCAAQRVHGDLHLGQVLRGPDGDWTLIDFEGEPDRPLDERRLPQPVVRDIAGMLRSFDYAACQQTADPSDRRADDWAADNRAAYCAGYAEASGADPRDQSVLLRAYETDKAIYEVLYEARHRPSWLPIPMSAIRRLATPPGR